MLFVMRLASLRSNFNAYRTAPATMKPAMIIAITLPPPPRSRRSRKPRSRKKRIGPISDIDHSHWANEVMPTTESPNKKRCKSLPMIPGGLGMAWGAPVDQSTFFGGSPPDPVTSSARCTADVIRSRAAVIGL